MKRPILTSLFVCALFPSAAPGAVVVASGFQNNGTNSNSHTYVASSTDLINGLVPSASAGTFNREGTGNATVLTNGAFPSPLTRPASGAFQFGEFLAAGMNSNVAGNSGVTSLTFTLSNAADIASIDVYGGWQDQGRDQQSYSVFYALDSAPSTFIALQTVNFNPSGAGLTNGTPVATRTTISEDATGILASNVRAFASISASPRMAIPATRRLMSTRCRNRPRFFWEVSVC